MPAVEPPWLIQRCEELQNCRGAINIFMRETEENLNMDFSLSLHMSLMYVLIAFSVQTRKNHEFYSGQLRVGSNRTFKGMQDTWVAW